MRCSAFRDYNAALPCMNNPVCIVMWHDGSHYLYCKQHLNLAQEMEGVVHRSSP